MPLIKIWTTLPAHRVPKNFQSKCAELLVQILGKHYETMIVDLKTDQNIFAGSDPDRRMHHAYVEVRCVARVSAEYNRKVVLAMTKWIEEELGVMEKNFRLEFVNVHPDHVAINNKLYTDSGMTFRD